MLPFSCERGEITKSDYVTPSYSKYIVSSYDGVSPRVNVTIRKVHTGSIYMHVTYNLLELINCRAIEA